MTEPPASGRVLVVTSCLAPMVSGSAKLLRNLLSPFPPGSLVYLRGNNDSFKTGQEAQEGHVEIADMPNALRRRSFRINLPAYLEYLWVPWIAWKVIRMAGRQKVRAIFANYPFGYFLVAAWLASRLTGLPLYVYMHDLWEETIDIAGDRWVARQLEGRIFRDAAAVYVTTSAAADHYRAKHGTATRLLPHTVRLEDAPTVASPPARGPHEPLRVLFTGGVYNMNRDTLLVMVRVIEALEALPGGREVRLLVCAPNDASSLEAMGVRGNRVDTAFVETQEAIRLQQKADLLYLPLSFGAHWEDEIRTVFPTKAVEYLVSGTPILLHGPAGCSTVRDARRNGWAYVVETQDPEAVADALRTVLGDEELRLRLVENARAAARARDARGIARALQEDMGLSRT